MLAREASSVSQGSARRLSDQFEPAAVKSRKINEPRVASGERGTRFADEVDRVHTEPKGATTRGEKLLSSAGKSNIEQAGKGGLKTAVRERHRQIAQYLTDRKLDTHLDRLTTDEILNHHRKLCDFSSELTKHIADLQSNDGRNVVTRNLRGLISKNSTSEVIADLKKLKTEFEKRSKTAVEKIVDNTVKGARLHDRDAADVARAQKSELKAETRTRMAEIETYAKVLGHNVEQDSPSFQELSENHTYLWNASRELDDSIEVLRLTAGGNALSRRLSGLVSTSSTTALIADLKQLKADVDNFRQLMVDKMVDQSLSRS